MIGLRQRPKRRPPTTLRLIPVSSVGAPADAEALYLSIWQSCFDFRAAISLMILGQHGQPPVLGVCSRKDEHCEFVADLIAAAVRDGDRSMVHTRELYLHKEMELAYEKAAINMIPHDRNISLNDPTYWGTRFDPLGDVYTSLGSLPEDCLGGVGVICFPWRNGQARIAATAFGMGRRLSEAMYVARRLETEYAVMGMSPAVAPDPGDAIARLLEARLPVWRARVRDPKKVTSWWHPPYESAGFEITSS